MAGFWPWLGLAGLGMFHGLNPAMGWLFAVALGLHRGSRRVVLQSVVPIALGHAAAILAVVLAVMAFGTFLDPAVLRRLSGLLLIAWAGWHAMYGHRHRVRIGMQTGLVGLGVWSFLMATAHGAGLMLLPLLGPLGVTGAGHGTHHHAPAAEASLATALLAVSLHTAAMLAVITTVALLVYGWLGLGFLRRGWINLDLLWTAALVVTGIVLLV